MKNREIKFRVWDKINQKFIQITDLYHLINYKFNDNLNDVFKDDSFIFQQFTGLKDKNDKEIYEGDIVNITSPKQNDIGKVIYDESSFKVKNQYGYNFALEGYCKNSIEKLRKSFRGKTKNCPYYKLKEINGVKVPWCDYLGLGGTEGDGNWTEEDWGKLIEHYKTEEELDKELPLSLLFDGCKECGENECECEDEDYKNHE